MRGDLRIMRLGHAGDFLGFQDAADPAERHLKDRRRLLVKRAVVGPLAIVCCLGLTGLTGFMAYLSVKQPWTYQKIRNIPQAALELFVDPAATDIS